MIRRYITPYVSECLMSKCLRNANGTGNLSDLDIRHSLIRHFLSIRHSKLVCPPPDRYDLPKGHVDAGETEMQCALRELVEETGIAADDIVVDPDFRFTLQYSVRYKRTNFQEQQKTLVIFLGQLQRNVEIALTEHKGYQWVDWNPPHVIILALLVEPRPN